MTATTVQQHLSDSIEGHPVPFSDVQIAKFTDIGKVRKAYKLIDTGRKPGRDKGKGRRDTKGQDEGVDLMNGNSCNGEAERSGLEVMVLGLMALRGAT